MFSRILNKVIEEKNQDTQASANDLRSSALAKEATHYPSTQLKGPPTRPPPIPKDAESFDFSQSRARTASVKPSVSTIEKSFATKAYLEKYYEKLMKEGLHGKNLRRQELQLALTKATTTFEKLKLKEEYLAHESSRMRMLRAEKMTLNHFEILKILGHGGFGIVKLVREKRTGDIFALKMVPKAETIKRRNVGHVLAERDLLSDASEVTEWIVKLVYSFQDDDYLYFVMEYMPGGDLLGLLIKLYIFEEDFAKRIVAEIVLSIEEVHRLGIIHRDIKPDNFLFDKDGHIRLCDFGLAQDFHWSHDANFYSTMRRAKVKDTVEEISGQEIYVDVASEDEVATTFDPPKAEKIIEWRKKNRKKEAHSIVGTNNYMACEVLLGNGYDKQADWWSLGILIFEMLYGYPPFCAKTARHTQIKIVNWKHTLQFPDSPKVSEEAKDLIKRLICDKEHRLGHSLKTSAPIGKFKDPGDADDIKSHPWFSNIEWDLLSVTKPSYTPEVQSLEDTSHFQDVNEEEMLHAIHGNEEEGEEDSEVMEIRKKMAFVGFTFRSSRSQSAQKRTSVCSIIERD